MTKPKLKTENLNIRLSPKDLETIKRLAAEKQMTVTDFILYLVRKEAWEAARND